MTELLAGDHSLTRLGLIPLCPQATDDGLFVAREGILGMGLSAVTRGPFPGRRQITGRVSRMIATD